MVISNYEVSKVLVDNGSLADILFYNTFMKIKLSTDRLTLMQSLLYRFTRKAIMPEETITLPMLMRATLRQVTLMVDFLMVKVSSTYNAMLGRPSLRISQAMVSIYHLMMKFMIDNEVDKLRGD